MTVLAAESKEDLQNVSRKFTRACERTNISINADKNKVQESRKFRAHLEKVKVSREGLDEVVKFNYLEIMIVAGEGSEEKATQRLHEGRKIWETIRKEECYSK